LISKTNKRFRAAFQALPESVKRHARQAYRLFRENPRHPSLQFREVEAAPSVYSVRIGIHHRALAVLTGDELVWFWIGSHAAYDKILRRL
jgi:hypothetical protein